MCSECPLVLHVEFVIFNLMTHSLLFMKQFEYLNNGDKVWVSPA